MICDGIGGFYAPFFLPDFWVAIMNLKEKFMATRPSLNIAVQGTKNTATKYNENFEMMMTYCEDVAAEDKDYTDNAIEYFNSAVAAYENINILDATSGQVPTFSKDTIYSITPTGAVEFSLPTITGSDAGKFYQILVFLTLNDTSYVTADEGKLGTENYFYGVKPTFNTTGKYNIIYEYDGSDWVVGVMKKGTTDAEE